jgi:hypothetical protein
MQWKTAYNHKKRASMAVYDIYSSAKICHMSHDELIKSITKIKGTISHCPVWVTSYIEAFCVNFNIVTT